jgi:penicillin-binding protein 1A
MKQAILAAEDERFYSTAASTRKAFCVRRHQPTWRRRQAPGRFDDHQQVARNFFLSSEKTYVPQALRGCCRSRSSTNLSKDQIFELYINQIFLGQRAYGFGRCGTDLLWQVRSRTFHDRRSGDAGRPAEGALGLQSGGQSEARPPAPAVRAAPHARAWLHLDDEQHEAATKAAAGVKRETNVSVHAEYVPKWPARSPPSVSRKTCTARLKVLHHHHAKKTRRPPTRACARGARLRPPARLPRRRSLRRHEGYQVRPG